MGGILSSPGMAVAETVNLPLTIDYPLMRSLAVATAFTDPGESAIVLDENQGCRRITLSAPNYRAEGSHLKFEVKAQARLGTALGNTCLAPVEWEGYVVFEQRPRIETQSWQLYFETLDSTLYDRNHRPARVAGVIWGLIDTYVHAHLSAMQIDLAPPVSELKAFLKSLFPPELKNRAEHMLNTLRPTRSKLSPKPSKLKYSQMSMWLKGLLLVRRRNLYPALNLPINRQLGSLGCLCGAHDNFPPPTPAV